MDVAIIEVSGIQATTIFARAIPSGIIGARILFRYTDPEWDDLVKNVIIRHGGATRTIVDATNVVELPKELVSIPSAQPVWIGVYGVSPDGSTAIPTLWTQIGIVRNAADPSRDPTSDTSLPIWAQILLRIEALEKSKDPEANLSDFVRSVNGIKPDPETGDVEIVITDSGGNGAYTLPVANTETLGGVKPVAKTEAMTQPVGVDANGALYTEPGKGGTVEVDTTLTKEGMAADAKAVGDALKEVGQPTDEQIAGAVSDWIEANPDKVTTVQDGAICTEKLADNAVTPEKTAFLNPVGKLVEAECIIPNTSVWGGYADTANTLYYNAGWLETSPEITSGVYVCPVKAGQLYTIVPTTLAGTYGVYFCTAYSLKEPTDEQKAVWTRPTELLGYMSYTGAVKLCNAFTISYNDRQTKLRYTPTSDGYLVGLWHMISGMLVYEGASPSAKYEEIIDAPDGAITSANYIFYAWSEKTSERFRKLSRVDPDEDTARLLRRGAYYQNLILSNLKLKCFGDSITFGSSVGVGNRYLDFLGAKLGISIENCGVNGATVTTGHGMAVGNSTGVDGFIAKNLANNTENLVQATEKEFQYDVFTIALGTNDWIYNAPLGTYADTVDTATFYGCYKKLIARIRELYPNAPIILLTPWQQFYNDIHWYEANDAGFSIRDYAMAIHEIAMMTRNCWVIDMLNNAHITEKDNSEDGVYVDGVHIGRKAHILVAHELEKVLMQVIMMNGLDYVPLTIVTDSFTGQK